MMDFGPEILQEFVVEAREHFETIEEDILQLFKQQESPDRELVDKIFRSIHTVKGAAGFLQLEKIGKLSHVMETLLSMLRAGEAKPEKKIIDGLLAGVDSLISMLNNVEKSNEYDISDVYNQITELLEEKKLEYEKNNLKPDIYLKNIDGCGTRFKISHTSLKNLTTAYGFLYILKYDLVKLSKKHEKSPVKLICKMLDTGEILDAKIEACSRDLSEGLPTGPLMYFVLYATDMITDILCKSLEISEKNIVLLDKSKLSYPNADSFEISSLKISDCTPDHENSVIKCQIHTEKEPDISAVQVMLKKDADDKHPAEQITEESGAVKAKPVTGSALSANEEHYDIRVNIDKIDMMINLVGELVIAESMVTNNPNLTELELEGFDHAVRNLHRIINELQDVVLSIRMIPLSKTFRKTIRIVHSLSNKTGKKCHIELKGEETEVDKSVIENITDPLIHIIRNCVDHGIESPDERKVAGKPEIGNIILEAKHEGGEVIIRISDDGRGLNKEKILSKGIERGLIRNNGKNLTESEIFRLIFEPGFSTAEKITDVSGRGVGLDVVKRNLEKLKGRADIRSIPGKGTTMTLRIPLTMAIIDGMIIRVGNISYTIPMLSVKESFRPLSSQITVTMDGQEIVRIRDDLMPVIRLHKLYNIIPDQTELTKGILVSVVSDNRSICLFADEILGHNQTVIKGMPGYVASARGISGCTILGNGDVSLILDVKSIINDN